MIFTATKYQLKTVATGRVFDDEGWTLDDKECPTPSMVRPVYENKQLDVKEGACLGLYRYADWLPIKTMLNHPSEPITYKSEGLARRLGLRNLYITFNGWWPERGAKMTTCSFKEMEAFSVCARLGEEQRNKVLVVASAGNTARAFAKVCSDNGIKLLLCVPQDNIKALWFDKPLNPCVKLITTESGSDYFDAHASHPETVFCYNTVNSFFINHDKDTLLSAYFMHDNVIYMIETDKTDSYLSKFDGQKPIRLNKLNQRYQYIGCSNLGYFSGGNGGLFYCLPSQNNSDDKFYLIDTSNNFVKIIDVITNQRPSLSFSGKDGLKETLAFVTDRFSSKTIEDADALESHLGSYRNIIPSYLKYKSQYKSESRTYYRLVDKNTFTSAEYGYDPNTGFLNSLFLEWRPSSELSESRYNNKKDKSFPERQIRQKVIATINHYLVSQRKKTEIHIFGH